MPVKKAKKPAKKNLFDMLQERRTIVLLGLILLAALVMRLYQPDWYKDRSFHPDERWIVLSAVEQLHVWGRPIGLQYGSLPLYMLSVYKDAVNAVAPPLRLDAGVLKIAGARVFSGLADALTIVFIFLLASLLFGDGAAIFACLLAAFTPLNIHSAHFFTVDTFVSLFVVMTVYFSARIYKKGGKRLDYILAAVCYAAAIASKTAALPAVLVIIVAHFLHFFSVKGFTKKAKDERMESWIKLAIAAVVTFMAFFAFMPYAVLDFNSFVGNQMEQQRILITGEADVPYNRQYLNTTPYIYYLKNLVLYTMGLPYGTFAVFAFLFYVISLLVRIRQGKPVDKDMLLLLAWTVPYFLIVGKAFGKFNRYMLPFTPFLAIIASKLLLDMQAWIKDKRIVTAVKWLVAGGAIFYGLAFMNVYSNSHPWIQASRWMYANIPSINVSVSPPRQTKILNEMWGDDLPVYADGKTSGMYSISQWPDQEPDDQPFKMEKLSTELSADDYVVMADKRAYGTYQRIPDRYPLNYFYYSNMIKNPELFGYKLAYEKAVYPSFPPTASGNIGITIKDDKADESFQLYDHPHVYIFKNEKYLSKPEIQQLLMDGMGKTKQKFGSTTGYGNPNIGELRDRVAALAPALSVFFWYLLVQLLALAVMPLQFKAFGNMKDAGYGLAKAMGIILFTWINWMFVNAGVWKFYQANLWVLFAACAALAGYWYWLNREKVGAFIGKNASHILRTELIFLGAYMFFILIKLYAPDIHNISGQGYNGGGEPMGMAYLSSIFNDVKFPPHDPWMAGFTLNYYYWGQLMMATLTKMLGYLPQVTYNLSLSLLFALCFTTAFTLVYNMTGKYKYGIFAGFLLAMAGNFHTMEMTLGSMLDSHSLMDFVGRITTFQFIWDPTRIYPTPVITEMPFFSYLYGDLHAHNIVIPFTVLLMAVLYNIIKTENKTGNIMASFGGDAAARGINIFLVALLFGSMTAINTWNFPPALMFIVMIIGIAAYINYNAGKTRNAAKNMSMFIPMIFDAGAAALAILVAGYVFFWPFHHSFVIAFKTVANFISKGERVDVYTMFKYYAVFFIVIFAYIWLKASVIPEKIAAFKLGKFKFKKALKYAGKFADKVFDKPATSVPAVIIAASALVFVLLLVFVQATFALLFLMIGALVWTLIYTKDRDEAFAIAAAIVPLCVVLGTEIVFIADGRMNTVFKFYMVAWTFLSIAVPYLLYKTVASLKKIFVPENLGALITAGAAIAFVAVALILKGVDNKYAHGFLPALLVTTVIFAPFFMVLLRDKLGKYIFTGALVFLLIPAVFYPLYGAFTKMAICSNYFTQKPRIDGLKYMETLAPRPGSKDFDSDDYKAINWINRNFTAIEPILEAPGEQMYSGLSRISIFTGMPSYIGWGYQVTQQSGRSEEVNRRNRNANMVYSLPADAVPSVAKNEDFDYLYVGGIERGMYADTQKFDEMFTPVFSDGAAKLYKVK